MRLDYGLSLPSSSYRLIARHDTFLVVSKDSGLLTVPGIDKPDCLMSRLCLEYPTAKCVHRLDRDTSGLLVVALEKKTHRNLSIEFENRRVDKMYYGKVRGKFPEEFGKIERPIGKSPPGHFPRIRIDDEGREATTLFRRVYTDGFTSILELKPVTGRPQQLRVHLASIGYPLVGDTLHGDGEMNEERLCLHSTQLNFTLESTNYSFFDPCPFI